MKKLETDRYIDFCLGLFNVEKKPTTIRGIKFQGERKDGYLVLLLEFWKFKDSCVDEEYLEQLESVLKGRASKRIYVIAPENAVDFIEDTYDAGDITFYFLKIPYQVIRELHPVDFSKIRQPQSKKGLNDLEKTIGFHFMRQPKVNASYNDGILTISTFLSDFSDEETKKDIENFESLSMVIVDKDYNGDEFVMDECFFKDDIGTDDNGNLTIAIPEKRGKMLAIFVDIYGNEFKQVF